MHLYTSIKQSGPVISPQPDCFYDCILHFFIDIYTCPTRARREQSSKPQKIQRISFKLCVNWSRHLLRRYKSCKVLILYKKKQKNQRQDIVVSTSSKKE